MSRTGLVLLVCGAAHGYAGERLVHGNVVRVEPINARSHLTERRGDCEPAKPPADAGLASVLGWDLRAGCRTIEREVETVEGYRVYYEWDNRLYNTVMSEWPADTILLRVNVN